MFDIIVSLLIYGVVIFVASYGIYKLVRYIIEKRKRKGKSD